MAEEKLIGRVTHYYDNLKVAILDLSDSLAVGQTVHFKGAHDDYTQTVDQMQVEHLNVQSAKAGDAVGVRVDQKVHENALVFVAV